MSDLAAALERAQSRAAVLQSLQNSYGAESKASVSNMKKSKSTNSLDNKNSANTTTVDKGAMNDLVDVLSCAIADSTMKTKQFFKDALRGKAIVVENVKAQLDASKASKRMELAGKRKRTISNRAMKRLKVADPTVLPSDEEVQSLHNLWWEYCLQMIGNCHSEAQLQARIQSMEHIGARVYVLDALKKSTIGIVGIITGASKNCYYLAVDTDASSCNINKTKDIATSTSSSKQTSTGTGSVTSLVVKAKDEHTSKTSGNNVHTEIQPHKNNGTIKAHTDSALMVLKSESVLGIVLPAQHHKATQQPPGIKVSAQDTQRELFQEDSVLDTTGTADSAEVKSGYKFDFHERNSGGRICVLYGNYYMPDCKFD